MASPEGPSFLTSAPVVPPDPDAAQRKVLVPVSTSPYRTQGELSQPKPRAEKRVSRPPSEPSVESPRTVIQFIDPLGDHAGEHLEMERGKYSAWFYVVLAFGLQALMIAALPIVLLVQMLPLGDFGYAVAATIGLAGALWCFHDRWRCIEAFSSRFCSGIMNLSIFYVPLVAFVYANTRALGKLRR